VLIAPKSLMECPGRVNEHGLLDRVHEGQQRRKAVHFLVQLIYMEGICGDVFPMSMGGF